MAGADQGRMWGANLSANAVFQAMDICWMYRPLRGQVRSHSICFASGFAWSDLFASKLPPTDRFKPGADSDDCSVQNVGADLSANAVFQAVEKYRMHRPLRGQVRLPRDFTERGRERGFLTGWRFPDEHAPGFVRHFLPGTARHRPGMQASAHQRLAAVLQRPR